MNLIYNIKNMNDLTKHLKSLSLNKDLGQYFTTDESLLEKLTSFIKCTPKIILEPSAGRGDIIHYVKSKMTVNFVGYEIDTNIKPLDGVTEIVYADFLATNIDKKYTTIVGNPPYIKNTDKNVYIKFIEKCINLLDDNGELIFIIPSEFFNLTSSAPLLKNMLTIGSLTHIYHPHNERLFYNASVDVLIFRYQKGILCDQIKHNDQDKYCIYQNNIITFNAEHITHNNIISDIFNVAVGMVSGKDAVYKNDIGNITVLVGNGKLNKYIFIDKYPSGDEIINNHLTNHKQDLLSRKIKKFNDTNWFEWGAPRNIKTIKQNIGRDCIYIYCMTRQTTIAFIDKVQYFGGNLLILIPKKDMPKDKLELILTYLNSDDFKKYHISSGRFKITHRVLSNSGITI